MLSKAGIMVEGEETKRFKRYIRGKITEDDEEDENQSEQEDSQEEEEDEDDSDEENLLKYESSFVKRMLLP
jgi:hypothetical protein